MGKQLKRRVNSIKYLQKRYLSAGSVGSLGGIDKFVKHHKHVGIGEAEKALTKLPTFALFRPQKRKQVRRPVIAFAKHYLVQFDLAEFRSLSRSNGGIKYLFCAIDIFSKRVYYSLLKRKDSESIATAIKKLLADAKYKIRNIQSDQEPAAYSSKVLAIFKKHGVNFYSSKSPLKASISERVLLTLKRRIYKWMFENKTKNWVSAIDKIIKAYNSEVHSSTGFAPIDVKPKHYSEIAQRLYEKVANRKTKPPAFKINQAVRISQKRLVTKTFSKSYDLQWSPEIFYINSYHTLKPIVSYILRDSENSVLNGTFVEQDLRLADDNESDSE